MFFKIRTKLYFFNTKKKRIVILLLPILLLVVLGVIFCFVTKNKTDTQTTDKIIPLEDTKLKTEETRSITLGVDIKNKYKEVQGTDFAILVTTDDLLKGIETNGNKDYYRYILEDNEGNKISTIKDKEGNDRDAIFVNYNRLLKDLVVTKDISGGYITPYGFTANGDTKFNKYSQSKSIAIKNNAEFTPYPIYDGNYKEIGILYIETMN